MTAASSHEGRSQVLRLQPDLPIYLEVSGLERERCLHSGRLLEVSDAGGYRVRFDQAALEIQPSDMLQLYFDWERTFTKQLVHAVKRDGDEGVICLDLRPLGEPVSAESRECYRVSAHAAHLMAHLGDSPACEVVDVSASGFSVYTRQEYAPGHALRATLLHDGALVEGLVRVRNQRRTRSGRLRCGVSCIDDSQGNSGLARALTRINLALQRAQLARRTELLSAESAPPPRFVPRRRRR